METTFILLHNKEFKTKFEACRKKIKNCGKCDKELNELIQELIQEGTKCSILNPLDVVKIDDEICSHDSPGIHMTLLGYCILYNNMKAMELLLDNGADILCSNEAGSPLFQALAHCYRQHTVGMMKNANAVNDHISESPSRYHSHSAHELKENHIASCCYKMTNCFSNHRVDIQQCKCYVHPLNDDIVEDVASIFVAKKRENKSSSQITHHDYKVCHDLHLIVHEGKYPYNICYMAFILNRRKTIARALLYFNADFLEAKTDSLPSYLQEYCKDGTSHYLSWLLNTLSDEKCDMLIEHIKGLLMTIGCSKGFNGGRNIVHSLLLNGNEQCTRKAVEKLNGYCNLLDETDSNGRTALHIAAEMGEAESVKVLINMGADVMKCDQKEDTPLISAARRKSKKNNLIAHFIIRHLLERLNGEHDQEEYKRQESFVSDQLEKLSEIESSPDETSFVQVAWNYAAKSRNLKAIKAIAHKCKVQLPRDISSSAIKSGDLETVQVIDGIGKMYMPQYSRTRAFLEACQLEFTEIRDFYFQNLNTDQRLTAIYYASERNNIIALKFLIWCEVDVNVESKKGYPLLIAAGQGHDGCVALLLEAGADLSVKDHRGYNCLMIAAEKKHENVVKAILESGSKEYKRLFQVWTQTTEQDTYYITPLKLLIEHMPDMARLYLDSCDKQESERYACIDDTFIMDGEKDKVKKLKHQKVIQNQENHVISCMIKHERQELLKQELVSQWIKHKWRRAQIIYYFTIVIYCSFLAVLTAFATVSPRPTDIMACTNSSNSGCLNSTGEYERMYFTYSAGGVLLILAALHLVIELLQLYYLQRSYFSDWENYLQIFIFIGTLLFISAQYYAGIANCWCASKGMWQFGAAVVTCSWCNLIVILRSCPLYSIGSYTTLLFTICWRYLKVIYLHILLIASFAFSFYMLLVVTMGVDSSRAFSTPWWALGSTFFGTTGFDSIFVATPIAYPAMGIILFSTFYVVVTMLFTNMLIGLSTSDAIDALKKAELYSIACQVKFILFIKKAFPFIHYDSKDESE